MLHIKEELFIKKKKDKKKPGLCIGTIPTKHQVKS